MLYPYKSHIKLFDDNAFYVESVKDMIKVMDKILSDSSIITQYRARSFAIAKEMLDYKKQAEWLYE